MPDATEVEKAALKAVNEVKTWYQQKPFYVGLAVGAIVALIVRHFV